LNKISSEIELSISEPFSKDKPTLVSILSTPISLIQNNPPFSSLPSLSYKSLFLSSLPMSKIPTVEVKEIDNVDSDIKIQPLSHQQPLQPTPQTLKEGPELRRFTYQTQVPFRNIYRE